jgi:hypothetical protein
MSCGIGSEQGRDRATNLAILVLVAGLAFAPERARASIVYTAVNETLAVSSSDHNPSYQLAIGGKNYLEFSGFYGTKGSLTTAEMELTTENGSSVVASGPSNPPAPAALAAETLISSASTFSSYTSEYGIAAHQSNGLNSGNFVNVNDEYLGFKFVDSGQTEYGWVEVSDTGTTSPTTDSFTIEGYAYDNTGAAIKAGQTVASVPEPSSLVMGALGTIMAAGYGWTRRRPARRGAAVVG